jgi:hypothetical protein
MTSILKVDNLQDANGTGTPYIKGAVLQVSQLSTTIHKQNFCKFECKHKHSFEYFNS